MFDPILLQKVADVEYHERIARAEHNAALAELHPRNKQNVLSALFQSFVLRLRANYAANSVVRNERDTLRPSGF